MSSGWGNDPDAPGSAPGQSGQGPRQPGQGPTQPGYPGQPAYPGQPDYPAQPAYPGQPASPGQHDSPAAPPPGYGGPAPQPGYGAPPPPGYLAAPPNKRPSWLGPAIIGIIAVLLVGGFFLFRDRLGNDVTTLAVGECFDTPTDETAEVSDVQRQPCNEPHGAEVIASLTHPAPAGEAYPVVSGFDDYIQENCVPAFNSYTGRDWETDTELTLSFFRPTLTGWGEGDRGFTCFIVRVDGAKMTNSVRAGAGASP